MEAQAVKKFERVREFSGDYNEIERKIDSDTSEEAKVLYLITKTGFRVGGEGDTGADEQAYGASTLTSDHVSVDGDKVLFNFKGKHGKDQVHYVQDQRLAEMVKDKSGRLFETNHSKILKYVKQLAPGKNYKVHDFRTHIATETALSAMQGVTPPTTAKELEKAIMTVATTVSKKLGNSPKMARDSYIDPLVFQSWKDNLKG